jgi:hypothetical protein
VLTATFDEFDPVRFSAIGKDETPKEKKKCSLLPLPLLPEGHR